MTFGAPETEALYEGSAQKGFGDPRVDGSPMPLGSTATSEPIEIPRSLWGRWKSLDDHRDAIASLWFKKQSIPKQININDNQCLSRDKRFFLQAFSFAIASLSAIKGDPR
jgi:hypothetical protein